MTDLIARIERLVTELASQQLARDDWWRPELASIKEALADVDFEQRMTGEQRVDAYATWRVPVVPAGGTRDRDQ